MIGQSALPCRSGARAAKLCALVLGLPFTVFADAVPPPPEKCPGGQIPITSHAGPECVAPAPTDCPPGWRGELRGICRLDICVNDQGCGAGKQCRQVELCL